MRITDLLALSIVPRWSNVRHSPSQSVADHSFRVAHIYLELCCRLRKEPTLRGLTFAMSHDGLESYTGDIPGDFKETCREELEKAEERLGVVLYEKPTDSERRMVKIADKIETYTFIRVNGVGPHAKRIEEILRGHLIALAGEDWNAIRLLTIDIVEESDRN